MKKKALIVLIAAVTLANLTGCGQSWERTKKSLVSEYAGGLYRVVTVYDQQGNIIKTYEGNIDIQDTEYGNKILFDLNGKRIVVYNGTVITEEQ